MSNPPLKDGQRTVKLRSSCNACGAAKVRCTKEHPSCERCIALNIECVYGYSKKIGRARRTWTCHSSAGDTRNILPKKVNEGEMTSAWIRDDMAMPWLLDTQTNGKLLYSDAASNSAFSNDFGFYFPLETDFQFPFYTDSSLGTPQISTPSLSVSDDASESPYMNLDQLPTACSKYRSKMHECYQRAYSILGSLHLRPQASCFFVSPSDDAPIQSLVDVLSRNRTAVNDILKLLECSCSQQPHVAMLYASITSKILARYQVAAVDSVPCSSSISSECSGLIPRSSPRNSMDAFVVPRQMAIGTFCIDERDQESLTRRLLLREVKKSGHLIDVLCAHGGGGMEGNVYSSLGVWLRTQFSKTITMLENGLEE